MYYQFDMYGRFCGLSEAATERSTEVVPPDAIPDYNWNGTSWVLAPNIQSNPVALLPEHAAATRALSKLQYMDRFTGVELAAIYAAAKVSVEVEIWLERFKLAQDVDLNDERTRAGLLALESAGLICEGRAAEILA